MTPLAQRYFGQLTKPVRDRAADPWHLCAPYDDLHCFEVTAIHEAVSASIEGRSYKDTIHAMPGPFFLPSPVTWLEFESRGERFGYMLTPYAGTGGDGVLLIIVTDQLVARPLASGRWPNALVPEWHDLQRHEHKDHLQARVSGDVALSILTEAMFLLDIVNTPGLVVLTQRPAHKGFARNFTRVTGSYPLRAWHEVTVDPAAIREVTTADGHLCGRKCLHFVRAHRRRLGPGLEVVVRAHWRGDPAIGIQRTRYRVGS